MAQSDDEEMTSGGDIVYRHGLGVRLWHWVTAISVIVLFMSGLMIFNAHPRLYWGEYGANYDPAWLEFVRSAAGEARLVIGGRSLAPSDFLQSVDHGAFGLARPFPGWATIPSYYSLSDARAWHFLFAWLLAVGLLLFLIGGLIFGHVQRRLFLRRRDVDSGHLWHEVKTHALLDFPKGQAAREYNSLQRWSYGLVVLILLPLQIFTGLTMSPAMDAAWPWLLDLFGGRQSARSIHFIGAFLLLAFFIVHIAMVLAAGPLNEMRAMLSGRYRLPEERRRQ